MKTRLACTFLAPILCLAALADPAAEPVPAPAPPVPLRESVPAGAFAFAETSGLAELIRSAHESELYRTIIASDSVQDLIGSDESKGFITVVKGVETLLRMDLWEAGEKLFGGRAAIALYPNPQAAGKGTEKKLDAFVLIQPADPKAWSKQRIWTDPLLAIGATRIARAEFKWGTKVYETKAGKGPRRFFALNKQWVMAASSLELLKRGLRLQDVTIGDDIPETKALAADAHFTELENRLPGRHLARTFIDTKLLSHAAGGRLGLPEKMDNPVASLLFGGVLEIVANSDLACLALDFEKDEFVFHSSFDGDPAKLDPRFQVFFAGAATTRELPEIPGLIAAVTLHRDLARWYQLRDDLLQDQILPGFDKFESGIGNILPGKDIGEDVIPLIGKNFTLLSALQDYDYLDGEPGVKLPGFALVVDLAEPDPSAGADMFQLFFQTFLSVLNLQAAEQNRQPWLIAARDHGGTQITYARYVQKPSGERLPTVFNFLPAAARVGDQYVVSSSLGMCQDLVDALKKPAAQVAGAARHNSYLQLDFAALAKFLDLNREHLVASRINEGRDSEHAIEDIGHLFLALKHLGSLSSTGSAGPDGFALRIHGSLK